jgi:hypothetical protein
MKNMAFITFPVVEIPIEKFLERQDENGNTVSLEYREGLYYEMDTGTRGEIANIERLMDNGFLPQREEDAIRKSIIGLSLNTSERKAKERAITRLRAKLL